MSRHIHLIGIGGSGLSAIAQILLERGYSVSGSDRALSPLTRDLASAGARVFEGHRAEQVQGADLVVRSSAIPDSNPEVAAARAAGIPVLKRSDFLGELMAGQTGLAVAGTHGKTTTTAMLAWLLSRLGQDPSYIIGGISRDLGGNARSGRGAHFVIEADEYDRMFLGLSPAWIILTYLEHDHPDCYPTFADYRQAFQDFIHRLQPGGGLLACSDYTATAAMAALVPMGSQAWTYGLASGANYAPRDLISNQRGGTSFHAWYQPGEGPEQHLARVELQVPGRHNVQNALAALALIHRLGLPVDQAAAYLAEFSGTGRRFDLLGEAQGVTVYNDYAHHPTEIRATLEAARQRYPERRIWAVWQPHTFSRTRTLFGEFTQSFLLADRVIVTEIYAARESSDGFSAAQVAAAISQPPALFAANLTEATRLLLEELQPGDVVLVMSAGDADQVSQQVLSALRSRETHHA